MHYKNLKSSILFICFLLVTICSGAQEIPDAVIKKNITVIDNPLQKVIQLSPVSFEYDHANYRHLKLQHGQQYGFIAENLQPIFPTLVTERSVSYMYGKNVYRNARIRIVDEASLVPILVAAIQEQQSEMEKLKADVHELKNKLSNLKK